MAGIEITWAGGEHYFRLNIGLLRALQQRCNAGPQHILNRLTSGEWFVDDVVETVRLGLEGGGLTKRDARSLASKHIEDRPITLSVITARLILMSALYSEDEDDSVGEAQGEAAATPPTSPTESGDSPTSTESESPSG